MASLARAALSTTLRSGCADWVVLGHGTNVTRVTRGENIFIIIIIIIIIMLVAFAGDTECIMPAALAYVIRERA